MHANKASKKDDNLELDIKWIYQIHKSGYSVKQIPIIFADRTKGVSKIPKIETLRTG